jgi:hypothetical protein
MLPFRFSAISNRFGFNQERDELPRKVYESTSEQEIDSSWYSHDSSSREFVALNRANSLAIKRVRKKIIPTYPYLEDEKIDRSLKPKESERAKKSLDLDEVSKKLNKVIEEMRELGPVEIDDRLPLQRELPVMDSGMVQQESVSYLSPFIAISGEESYNSPKDGYSYPESMESPGDSQFIKSPNPSRAEEELIDLELGESYCIPETRFGTPAL